MKDLQVIDQREVLGKDFKIYGDRNNPLFLAKDVAEWLGLTNVTSMLARVDPEEVTKLNLGGQQGIANFLTEDGLYEVLMQSRKPIARDFKKEVKIILKEIRLTGSYSVTNSKQELSIPPKIEKYMLDQIKAGYAMFSRMEDLEEKLNIILELLENVGIETRWKREIIKSSNETKGAVMDILDHMTKESK